MTNWLFIDLSVFLCVVAITGIIIPQILLIAFRKQLFDTPDRARYTRRRYRVSAA